MEKTTETGDARGGQQTARWHERISGSGEAVLIVDIDQVAAIRARHGWVAAEAITRLVADCLKQRLRHADRLALLREDEFLAVLPGAAEPVLSRIEARLRAAVHQLRVPLHDDVWTLSCSMGAAARSSSALSLESLVRAADSALWSVKRNASSRL